MCEECKKKRFKMVARPAAECGHMAPKAPMKWCMKCAESKKVCAACGKPLAK